MLAKSIMNQHTAILRQLVIGATLLAGSTCGWLRGAHAQGAGTAPQQGAQTPADQPMLTLRASSRLTLVDVTVTDAKGRPIQGLSRNDFHVEEDGKEQPIRNFEELRADTERPVAKHPPLPPGVYTNLQPAPSSSAVNVLLLDALNTKLTDQAFVKSETLAYLRNMPPGTRVAIMTLSNQLRVLQGFTQDSDLLQAAVKSRNNRQLPSPLLNTDVEDTNDSLADVVSAGTASALQEFANQTNAFQTGLRNEMTLEALDQIAAYLSTIPGRKNLIWFTAGMPLQIFPGGGVNDLATMTDYAKDLRHTTDLLTAAQIAVYPVDAQGLHGNPAYNAANGSMKTGAAAAAQNLQFLEKTGQEQLSMEAVAQATGGVAYYNTNGLKEAVTEAVANGANYYTVAYVPPNPKYDGSFHKLHVKVDHPGVHLAYRSGYYADDASRSLASGALTPAAAASSPTINSMASSMRRGVPASTQILFDVRVQPHTGELNKPEDEVKGVLNSKLQGKPLKRYDVQYIFPGRQIEFTETEDHKRKGGLEFQVAAYDVQGNMLNSVSQSIDLPLTAEQYVRLQHGPFQFFQQLDLPPGDIFLRIGVHDNTSERVGTLEIPLTVLKKSTPPPAAPGVPPPAQ